MLNQNGSSFGRRYSPSDTNVIHNPFLCTLRIYPDTNATRYPQFQYCINIFVDTPGVALPVSVQSSFGFRDDPPGYTASLRRLLKALLTLYRGWHNPPPPLNRLPHCCVHAHFGVHRTTVNRQCLSQSSWPTRTYFPGAMIVLHIAAPWSIAIFCIVENILDIRTSPSLHCLLGGRRRWASMPKAVEPGARGSFSPWTRWCGWLASHRRLPDFAG